MNECALSARSEGVRLAGQWKPLNVTQPQQPMDTRGVSPTSKPQCQEHQPLPAAQTGIQSLAKFLQLLLQFSREHLTSHFWLPLLFLLAKSQSILSFMTPLPQQQYHGIGKALGPGSGLARKCLGYLLRSKKGKQAPPPPCAALGGGPGLMVGTRQRVRQATWVFQVTHMQPVLPFYPGGVRGKSE